MSELAKQARKANREKAERLTRTDPTTPVDASGYTPPGALNADVQTGPKPTGRQHRKTGGKVQGAHAKARADKSPRKGKNIGGSLGYLSPALMAIDALRGDKDKNQGPGLGPTAPRKSGGRTKKADGGSFVPTERFKFSQGPSQLSRSMGLKSGGKTGVSDGEIEGTRPTGGRKARASGGGNFIKGAIKHPGALHKALHVPEGDTIPAKKLAKAEASNNPHVRRMVNFAKTLKGLHRADGGEADDGPIDDYKSGYDDGVRAEPGQRDYAASGAPPKAKGPSDRIGNYNQGYYDGARASPGNRAAQTQGSSPRQVRKGRKDGGRAGKGKMNVNIVIATGKPDQAAPAPMMPHPPIPMPPPGAGLPPGGLGAGGPPMPPPGMMGAPQGMPPMPRKRGGRTAYPIDGGSLGGKARLEKAEAYGPKR